jgi:hypothetical protein
MITVFNNLKKPNSQPIRHVEVTIELSWDASLSSIPRNEEGDFVIDAVVYASTDVDGYWEADLVPNDTIVPINSLYKITERLSDTNINKYYISVYELATPVSWVGDLIVSEPDWEA